MVTEHRGGGRAILFAKSPRPGHAKTRLGTLLDPDQCAAAARALLQSSTRAMRNLPAGWSVVLAADDPECPLLCSMAAGQGFSLCAQGEGDLGERMARVASAGLVHHEAVLLTGSDCTGYDSAYLRAATTALEGDGEAVLGPACDGGYVLIGLRRVPQGLFGGIPWGGERVAALQRQRLRACGMRWSELPVRADVDRPEDLWRLCPGLPGRPDQALVIARLSS